MKNTFAKLTLPVLILSTIAAQGLVAPSSTKRLYDGAALSGDDFFFTTFDKNESLILKVSAQAKGDANSAVTVAKLPEGSRAAGITADAKGDLWIADHRAHKIYHLPKGEAAPKVFVTVDKMNQPNDLVVTNEGVIFATDPNWQGRSGRIWMITPDKKATVAQADLGVTNGIALSPDQKSLYVTETAPKGRLLKFPINTGKDKALSLGAVEVLQEFPAFQTDGIATDASGNVYVPLMESKPHKGQTMEVYDSMGKKLKSISLKGQFPSNITVSSAQPNQAFVTFFGKPGNENGAFVERVDLTKP